MMTSAQPCTNRLLGVPILLVDDRELDLKLLRVVLAAEGCDVRTASSKAAALEVLTSFRPRIVLTDICMPDGGGLELTRSLKAGWTTRQIVVIAVTAHSDEAAARAAGCDGFIAKPVAVDDIAGQLRLYLAVPAERQR